MSAGKLKSTRGPRLRPAPLRFFFPPSSASSLCTSVSSPLYTAAVNTQMAVMSVFAPFAVTPQADRGEGTIAAAACCQYASRFPSPADGLRILDRAFAGAFAGQGVRTGQGICGTDGITPIPVHKRPEVKAVVSGGSKQMQLSPEGKRSLAFTQKKGRQDTHSPHEGNRTAIGTPSPYSLAVTPPYDAREGQASPLSSLPTIPSVPFICPTFLLIVAMPTLQGITEKTDARHSYIVKGNE